MNKSLVLYQQKNGYRYNSDSLFLYNFISQFSVTGEVLDIGCGCGILGLLIKRDFSNISMDMLDILEENVNISEVNAKKNNLKARIFRCDFLEYETDKKYNLLVSNPPFYHDGAKKSKNEHLSTSRYAENLPFEDFVKKSYTLLKDKGYFVFCYDAKQLPSVLGILNSFNFNVQQLCFIHPKEDKEASLVLVRARKNAKSLCQIYPSIVSSLDNIHSQKAREVFKKANTLSEDLI